MRKFKFEKLVRDKIPGDIVAGGGSVSQKQLNQQEFVRELSRKILEESKELFEAKLEKIPMELADIQELIDELCQALEITPEHLHHLQEKKIAKFGGFGERRYAHYVEVKDDEPWIAHYEKDPEQYQEIK